MELLNVYCEYLKSGKEFKKLEQWQIDKLAEKLPDEAIKPIPGAAKLSSINPVYVYRLFNDVFGIGGWTFSGISKITDGESLGKVEFLAFEWGIYRESYGGVKPRGNSPMDNADLAKSSYSDSVTKIASTISDGIAAVWRGDYNGDKPTAPQKPWINSKIDSNFIEAKRLIETGEIKSEQDFNNKFSVNTTTPIGMSLKKELLSLIK